MSLLDRAAPDPAGVASASCASLTAMTALGSTAQVTFTAPANGIVQCRMRGCIHGVASTPAILFGAKEITPSAGTLRGRIVPLGAKVTSANTVLHVREGLWIVSGLTPGNSYTWQAAMGVETLVASSALKWGGPNDAVTNNAFGQLIFEVWSTENLLAAKLFDPAGASTYATTALSALTAIDTTNLRLTWTPATTDPVLVRAHACWHGATGTQAQMLLGVLEGANIRGRGAAPTAILQASTALATDFHVVTGEFICFGHAAGSPVNWDLAMGIEVAGPALTALKAGGPDDATGNNAFGGLAYEVWKME